MESIDVKFINPFIEGALETLKTQCQTTCKPGKMFLRGAGNEMRLHVEIAAIIGLTSKVFKGSISICFPRATFLKIMGRMLGEDYQEVTSDLEDGAGELLNIIFGHAKRVLNEKNYAIEKAIPSIARGTGLSVKHFTPKPTVVLPFSSDAGDFEIEVAMDSV